MTDPIKKVLAVGPKGQGQAEAAKAWEQLAQAEPDQLTELLGALDEASPLASNWLRAAVDAAAEKALLRGDKLPLDRLEKFLLDTSHSPRARRLAFEWLNRIDTGAEDRLIPGFLDDPSLEFRRDAVARLLTEGEAALKAEQKEKAGDILEKALKGARDLDQIQALTTHLKKLERKVDLPLHFGFVQNWKLIGPFNNAEGVGYDAIYPPEKALDLEATYEGKGTKVTWKDFTSADEYGKVDLNEALGKANGVVAYAVTFFESDSERTVDFRLTSLNANKIWLNGKLLDKHHVYHSGSQIDQYVTQGTLKQGKNVILLKVCQNEQTESWAQKWEFQFRICDSVGTAILSLDRLAQDK